MISINDFQKINIRIGEILSAEKVPDTDKLLKLSVSFGTNPDESGEPLIRQVVSGIADFFPDPQTLVGTKHPFVTNLESRTIRGLESQAMILAAKTDTEFALLVPEKNIGNGATVV